MCEAQGELIRALAYSFRKFLLWIDEGDARIRAFVLQKFLPFSQYYLPELQHDYESTTSQMDPDT